MIVTIDRAGRIVVPKSRRERFNLVAGADLEMVAPGDCLELRRVDAEPGLAPPPAAPGGGGARGGGGGRGLWGKSILSTH